jgi:type I restriction enzyme M protein
MSDPQYKALISELGFKPKENEINIFQKKYTNCNSYSIEVDFGIEKINYGNLIKSENKTTQNFSQAENWVVLECVNRILEKGYQPQNIILEKTWASGHGTSGRLDICVTHDDGSEYLLIECKTLGKEFEKGYARMKKDGGQLFTYFKFSNKADVIMLYASALMNQQIVFQNEIVKIEENYRLGDVKDFYEKWNKLAKNNGIFEVWVKPYQFVSKALTPKLLEPIKQEDSSFIFNRFLEILRHNVVSDKGNAFNKIFTLFLCKIYDEKDKEDTDKELEFQWIEGVDDDRTFQLRLTDLYKKGMYDFLEKRVTDFSETEFNNKYKHLDNTLKNALLEEFKRIRLEKNNEFAIKDVYDKQSFKENSKVVKEVVELLQRYKIRYTKKQQYLSDFFELLLTTGLKQESGQFFTPVPIAQFIIKSLPIDKIVENKLLEGKKDDFLPYVMDYAAGSGHFLTEMMHEIQRLLNKINTSKLKSETKRLINVWQISQFDWALQYIYGIEKDYRLVKVGKVGCYLHGDGLANVIHSDGLARFKHPDYKGKLLTTDNNFPQDNKEFDIVVSNPPYSVSSFKNTSGDYYKEKDFELYSKLTDNSSEIECLFIERTKQLLKDGGVAGIILPGSILSNAGIYSKSRELILQYFDIVAIAEFGSNTFMATGTNTVTLFLRRRNNYDTINLKKAVDKFFTTLLDVTLNGIEKPVAKYVEHVWEGISFNDYINLLQQAPNKAIEEHEIYIEYRKKIKAKNDKEFWSILLEKENDKIHYFITVFSQKVVLVRSGEKDAEKRFLGYEFSNRRGAEGIHSIQRGKNIEDCTALFDPEIFDNPQKASTYIYKAFQGDYDYPIDAAMQNNITRHNLVDMLTFDRVDFEKNISLSVKKKVKIESKWEIVKIGDAIELISGQSPESEFYNQDKKGMPFYQGKTEFGDLFLNAPVYWTEKITKESIKGDVLMTVRAPVGPVNINPFDKICIGRGLNALRVSDKISNIYLFYYLKLNQEQITGNEGAIFQSISRDQVLSLKIPLPPKEIQQKIVSEIEVLEQKDKKNHERVGVLSKTLKDIFNDFSNKEEFKFSEIATLEYGKPLHRSQRIKGIYAVMGSNGKVGTHNEFLIKGPAIIVGRKGSAGKINFIEEDCFPIDTTFWVKYDNSKIHIKFFYYLLKEMNLENLAKGKGVGVPGLNRNNVHNLKIPLPPLSEQKKIVSKIEKIEKEIKILENEIKAIPAEKERILKKYLE